MRKLFLTILFMFLFCPLIFASVGVRQNGTYVGEATYIDALSGVTFDGSSAKIGAEVEAIATDDTLTANETGKTILVTATGSNGRPTFTLPNTSDNTLIGTNFTFVVSYEVAAKTNSGSFYIDPSGYEQIVYFDPTNKTLLSDGDRLLSTTITGDSVRLIADGEGNWYIEEMRGNFTDAD